MVALAADTSTDVDSQAAPAALVLADVATETDPTLELPAPTSPYARLDPAQVDPMVQQMAELTRALRSLERVVSSLTQSQVNSGSSRRRCRCWSARGRFVFDNHPRCPGISGVHTDFL
jgi:hypothetical protein